MRSAISAFFIPWLIFLCSWSIPLLIVESGMGKAARRGTVGTFAKLLGPSSTWRGAFVGFCAMAIGFYYSVVTLTTLGYGDVLPASQTAQVLVIAQVIIGYVMLGGLLSIFATRMGRRA